MKTWLKAGKTYAEVFSDEYVKEYPLYFMSPSCHTEEYADSFDRIADGGWAIEVCYPEDVKGDAVHPMCMSNLTLREENHLLAPNIHQSQGVAIEELLHSVEKAVEENKLVNPEVLFVGCDRNHVMISLNDRETKISLFVLIVKIEPQEAHDYWKKALIHAEKVCKQHNGTTVHSKKNGGEENA